MALAVAGGAAAQTGPSAPTSVAAPPAAVTAEPANPYSAVVPVAGTGDAARNTAIDAALTEVLQRVAPGLQPDPVTLAEASGYVRDFRYRRSPSGAGLELQVDFDPGAIGRLVAAGNPGASSAAAGAVTGAPAPTTAVVQGGSGTIWVGGLANSHAFATLLSLLRADRDLHDVVPVAAAGNGVLLRLDFDAPLSGVVAALTGQGGHLGSAAQTHPGADATLRWIP